MVVGGGVLGGRWRNGIYVKIYNITTETPVLMKDGRDRRQEPLCDKNKNAQARIPSQANLIQRERWGSFCISSPILLPADRNLPPPHNCIASIDLHQHHSAASGGPGLNGRKGDMIPVTGAAPPSNSKESQ